MDNGPIDDRHLVDAAEYREDCKGWIAGQLLTGKTVELGSLYYDLNNVLEDLTCMRQFEHRFRLAQINLCNGDSEPLSELYQEAAERIAENIVDEYIEYIAEIRGGL